MASRSPPARRRPTPKPKRAKRPAPSLVEPSAPEPPAAAPPPAPVPPPGAAVPQSRLVAAGLFFLLLAAVHVAISLFAGEQWYDRLLVTAYYAVPSGIAMLFLGFVPWRSSRLVRLVSALAAGVVVFAALLAGGAWALFVSGVFLLFLPVWAVFAVTGTGRFRWTVLQLVGATLLLEAVWIPLYASFPALTELATASGVLEPYTIRELYTISSHKLLHETLLIVVGLFLLARRVPWVQRAPGPGDVRATLEMVDAQNRHNVLVTLALGATTFLVALFGSLLLQNVLEDTPVGESGADDTRVFELITPELVVLLSFAAAAGEELIFRAVLQPAIERAFRRAVPVLYAAIGAIVVQAFLFGIVHAGYGNLLHILLPFAFGLLTGVVYRLWGLVPAVYAHFMIDVFAFGYDAAQRFGWVGPALTLLLLLNLVAGIAAPLWLLVNFVLRRRRPVSAPAE